MEEKRRVGRPVNHPKILIVELGEVVESYEEAAQKVGGNRGAICNILNNYLAKGGRKVHKGYHFKFVK